MRLRAVHPALADNAARAQCDRRLRRVIAGAEGIARRIDEREQAFALVVVEMRPDERRAGGAERRQPDDDLP